MAKRNHTTREAWLNGAIAIINKEFFKGRGYTLPRVRVSCGFPRSNGKAIGQCWDPKVSMDKTHEIFICPTQAEPVKVLSIMLHELIHAAVGIEAGHKGMFRKLAKEFGLVGKMTATFAEEGSELYNQLAIFSGRLGDYPHAAMVKTTKPTGGAKHWLRFTSPTEDAYRIVMRPDVVQEFGVPQDPWGNEMVLTNG